MEYLRQRHTTEFRTAGRASRQAKELDAAAFKAFYDMKRAQKEQITAKHELSKQGPFGPPPPQWIERVRKADEAMIKTQTEYVIAQREAHTAAQAVWGVLAANELHRIREIYDLREISGANRAILRSGANRAILRVLNNVGPEVNKRNEIRRILFEKYDDQKIRAINLVYKKESDALKAKAKANTEAIQAREIRAEYEAVAAVKRAAHAAEEIRQAEAEAEAEEARQKRELAAKEVGARKLATPGLTWAIMGQQNAAIGGARRTTRNIHKARKARKSRKHSNRS